MIQQKEPKFEIHGIVKSDDKHHGKCLSHTSQLQVEWRWTRDGSGIVKPLRNIDKTNIFGDLIIPADQDP